MRETKFRTHHCQSKMDQKVHIQLIFLCIINIIVTFPGVFLNALVIASLLKSSQLRKKLCNFMTLVLSCFDFLTVITNHPLLCLSLVFWLTENYDLLHKMEIFVHLITSSFLGFSFSALLVMSFERYLGAYHPVFHRSSLSKRQLLTLLAILVIFFAALVIMSTNNLLISVTEAAIIASVIIFPPFVFINHKLYKISKKHGRRNAVLPQRKSKIDLKNISTCLLAAACLFFLSIAVSVYVVFALYSTSTTNVKLCYFWANTIAAMNSTCNSLIFFWKNKVLRAEGMKILKTLKGFLFPTKESLPTVTR